MPHTEPQFPLRQLVRAYTEGQIDRHTYRSRRARLLDEMAQQHTTPPSTSTQAETGRTSPNPQTTDAAAAKPNMALIVALVVVAILIAFLGYRLVMEQGEEQKSLPPQQDRTTSEAIPPLPAPERPTATKSQGTLLEEGIKTFVKNNAWDDASQQRLLKLWNRTDPKVRASVKNSYWFRALDTELRALIKEERGLSSPKSIKRVDALMAFGSHLGLGYPEFAD